MAAMPPTIIDGSVTLTWGTAGQYYGYCTIADVKFEFTGSQQALYKSLTNSVIGQEITYAAIQIQKQLEHFYVMPYTGSDLVLLATLRQMTAWLAFANIYDKFFIATAPDESPGAAHRRGWVESKILDVVQGTERWDPPFADAVANAMNPVYDHSVGAFVYPNQRSIDPNVSTPIFSMTGISRYRHNDIM